jgi:putative transposase
MVSPGASSHAEENFLRVHTFETVEELRRALQALAANYNATWLVARHCYRILDQVRADQRQLARSDAADLPLAA